MTTREAAEICSITQPAWTMFETGKREPSFGVLYQICKSFNVSADWLLGLSDIQHAQAPSFGAAAEPKPKYGEEHS